MGFIRTLRRGATFAAIGAASGALVVTARHLMELPQPLYSALPGEGKIDRKHGGDIYYNLAGPEDAPPLVLLHDFYPGASNYEYHAVYPLFAQHYHVYAPDWLGFGMSEHPHIAYTGEFYATSLTGFLRDVVTRSATVIAHGSAANIAVRAASDTPDLFDRLILVSPNINAGITSEPTITQTLVRATQRVSLGIVPYALLSTRPALRLLARRRGATNDTGPTSDDSINHRYASAHQFGGQHAILAALTGELDLPLHNAFALLEPPVLILSGDRDPGHPRDAMESLAILSPHADLDLLPDTSDAVFEDDPKAFTRAVNRWLSQPQTRQLPDDLASLSVAAPTPATTPGGHPLPVSGSGQGGEVSAPATGATGATEDIAGRDDVAEDGHPAIGTPGAVTPGVSDMGFEGLDAITKSGITTIEPEVTLGPASAAEVTVGLSEAPSTPAAILPEAGEAGDATPATPATDTAVPTPPDTVKTPDTLARTVSDADGNGAEASEPTPPSTPPTDESRPRATPTRPAQSSRAAPRTPSPRAEPRGRPTSAPRRSATGNGGHTHDHGGHDTPKRRPHGKSGK
ncbi:MAG: hypothetical protein OJF49_001267 [Ktedonobacterales bacterium]|jgi:pimeloyl-ACP methyl ester carboxylesterase|nr:MAG: hypothetical protein OJF49_001267 [Ktedonobacterales bacterium]